VTRSHSSAERSGGAVSAGSSAPSEAAPPATTPDARLGTPPPCLSARVGPAGGLPDRRSGLRFESDARSHSRADVAQGIEHRASNPAYVRSSRTVRASCTVVDGEGASLGFGRSGLSLRLPQCRRERATGRSPRNRSRVRGRETRRRRQHCLAQAQLVLVEHSPCKREDVRSIRTACSFCRESFTRVVRAAVRGRRGQDAVGSRRGSDDVGGSAPGTHSTLALIDRLRLRAAADSPPTLGGVP
jgi:hypothetical protein